MHAGDKPYVVSPTGQIDVASRGLTLEALNTIVGQLLPAELQAALDEFGAVQYELPVVIRASSSTESSSCVEPAQRLANAMTRPSRSMTATGNRAR